MDCLVEANRSVLMGTVLLEMVPMLWAWEADKKMAMEVDEEVMELFSFDGEKAEEHVIHV